MVLSEMKIDIKLHASLFRLCMFKNGTYLKYYLKVVKELNFNVINHEKVSF